MEALLSRYRQLSSANQVIDELTLREKQILALAGQGLSNAEIGEKLHLSIHTIKSHVHNALRNGREQPCPGRLAGTRPRQRGGVVNAPARCLLRPDGPGRRSRAAGFHHQQHDFPPGHEFYLRFCERLNDISSRTSTLPSRRGPRAGAFWSGSSTRTRRSTDAFCSPTWRT